MTMILGGAHEVGANDETRASKARFMSLNIIFALMHSDMSNNACKAKAFTLEKPEK
jgi:hypothetical protein